MLKALIWDVDGTIAETERDGHRVAFNRAFEAQGMAWRWDEAVYGRLLAITGGRERLLHDMASRPDAPADASAREHLARALHQRKTAFYVEQVERHGIPLRRGVRALMDACQADGVRLAIATTTSAANVDALLRAEFGPSWAEHFSAVVCAEDAPLKKPHPQAYLLALQQLDCAAGEALAIEDSPNGLAAARAAGIATLVTPGAYFADADFSGALAVVAQLDDSGAAQLAALRRMLDGDGTR